MSESLALTIPDPEAMEAFGARLAACLPANLTIHLDGDLGAGKTTIVRGLLHGLGYAGTVKSPTYTLVEPYEPGGLRVYHFDLYRLADPEELEYLGVRDYFAGDAVCLVEWPERGAGVLPGPDLTIRIAYHPEGRRVELAPAGEAGRQVVACLRARR